MSGSLAAKAADGFVAADLPAITSLEDCQLVLDTIRTAVMTRRLSSQEGTAAARACSEWVKAEAALVTKRLLGELTTAVAEKDVEIKALKKQLAMFARTQAAVPG